MAAHVPSRAIAMFEPLFENVESHLFHSTAHFSQPICGGIFCCYRDSPEEGGR